MAVRQNIIPEDGPKASETRQMMEDGDEYERNSIGFCFTGRVVVR